MLTMVTRKRPGKFMLGNAYFSKFKSRHSDNSIQFALILGISQIAFMVLFGLFTDYDPAVQGSGVDGINDYELTRIYPWFQDTHVMIVVGFGFLMTFLKRYGWSSLGFNFLFTGFCIQWAILVAGFFHHLMHAEHDAAANATDHGAMIKINMGMMLEADFTTGAILTDLEVQARDARAASRRDRAQVRHFRDGAEI